MAHDERADKLIQGLRHDVLKFCGARLREGTVQSVHVGWASMNVSDAVLKVLTILQRRATDRRNCDRDEAKHQVDQHHFAHDVEIRGGSRPIAGHHSAAHALKRGKPYV